jgi:hypothetical protein
MLKTNKIVAASLNRIMMSRSFVGRVCRVINIPGHLGICAVVM